MESNEVVIDDALLLQDRLMRSLHRNKDGHLAANRESHKTSISTEHNIATLYVYSIDDDGAYMLHEHYIFSHQPLSYKEWLALVIRECFELDAEKADSYHGVYGWLTNHLRITPMRTGDLFIKIDGEGATGVRLTFDSRKNKRNAHKEKKSKSRR
jgi:hypothetical protein